MKNKRLKNVKISNVDNFTTDVGMKLRRSISKPLRKILKIAAGKKVIIDSYPKLDKDEQYIFASTHYFNEDIISSLASIDRSAYALIGTTDQIDNNPLMYAAWLYGLIYVDRTDAESRKQSLLKMERVLNNGSSVILFPEGGWNNTENLLCQRLFAGPYILAQMTGKKVVAISNFSDPDSDTIHIMASDPIDMTNMSKEEALELLRDTMASMMYEQIEKYSIPYVRSEYYEDIHLTYMESRRKEYLKEKWSRDVWDEELTVYQPKHITTSEEVRASLDNVHIDSQNAYILAPILAKREEDKKYDFKQYMKKNWNRK